MFCTYCGNSTEGLEWHPVEYSLLSGKVVKFVSVGKCRKCGTDFEELSLRIDYRYGVSYPVTVEREGHYDRNYRFLDIEEEVETVEEPEKRKFFGLF